jgi:hypothetical protein
MSGVVPAITTVVIISMRTNATTAITTISINAMAD